MKKNLTFILLFLFCGKLEKLKEEKEIRFVIGTEPPTLDPNLATDSVSHRLLTNLHCGLTRFDTEELKPKPCIAEWNVKEGGRVWEFRIREDAYWSDGVPITSYDFLNSWTRLLSPQTAAEYAYFLFDIEGAEEFNQGLTQKIGVLTPDDKTLIVKLKKPISYFHSIVSFMVTFPIRKDIIEKCKERFGEPDCYVSSGPFILKEWKHEYKIVLERNPYWFGKKPKANKVEFYVVSDPATALNLYRFGFISSVGLFPLAIRKFKNYPDFFTSPGFRGFYIGFNLEKINDVSIRRALAYATPRDKIVEVMGGIDIPATSWIPPGMLGHNPQIGLPFSPEKAKEEFEKSQNKEKFKKIKLYFNASPDNRKISEVIKESWRKILGIEVELESMEWKMFLKMIATDPPEVFRLGWGADYPDPNNFMDLFISTSGNNHTNFKNKEYDKIITLASQELDEKKRVELYTRAQKILLEEEVAIIPLFWSVSAGLKKPNIKIKFNPLDTIYLDEVDFLDLE